MITIVPNTPKVHWLSSDRDTAAWVAMVNTMSIGTEGQELDTGRRFYLDGNRDWKEWVDPLLGVLNRIESKLTDLEGTLGRIEFNTGEVIDETAIGLRRR